ncbi:TlpA family protein disulfide reductase [Lutibacter sp. A64]|uniref:TlpA family protein disulfide reductase n=1 Tax=Lutibacter sp. A64 TaxID=2918526 RepID=UPI001F06F409|nr:TlpA disulfide reductase family protein [Lutibacter sp. A64]UMB52422.1 TlpA family protein disulfide reductase [Lutibacter sp. A64]
MKKIFIILFSMLFLASCIKNPTKNYIVFSGTISDAPTKNFRLVKKNSGTGTLNIKLAEDGSFLDTLTTGTGHYIFTDSRNRADMYLTDGGEYDFTADGKDFRGTSKLTGTDPDASNYLMTKINNIIKLRGDYAEFNKLNESDFIATQNKLNESYIKYLESFPNVPKEFEEFEREELHYYHLLTLINYESLHQRYAEQPDFKVSADFLKELEGVNYVNEEAYKLRGSYTKLVEKHFKDKADELVENEGVDRYLAKLKVFGAIPNDFIKNNLIVSAANYDISYTNNIDEYYKAYRSVSTSTKNDESITKKYEALKKLSRGQISPIFTDYVNHAGGTSSLSDFEGKYVYIDVWATWCGPCLAEVPSLQKVEKQYHGKNIEFVSISIDTEKARDSWRKMVTDKGFGGVQLIADKDWKSDFISAYQINGIPRFILIDPNGKIISSNAPRPSKSELITLFNELGI